MSLSFHITNLALSLGSGRTEYQTTYQNRARRTVQFERRPSRRYSVRESHIIRQRLKQDKSESSGDAAPLQKQGSSASAPASTGQPQKTGTLTRRDNSAVTGGTLPKQHNVAAAAAQKLGT